MLTTQTKLQGTMLEQLGLFKAKLGQVRGRGKGGARLGCCTTSFPPLYAFCVTVF